MTAEKHWLALNAAIAEADAAMAAVEAACARKVAADERLRETRETSSAYFRAHPGEWFTYAGVDVRVLPPGRMAF